MHGPIEGMLVAKGCDSTNFKHERSTRGKTKKYTRHPLQARYCPRFWVYASKCNNHHHNKIPTILELTLQCRETDIKQNV